MLKFLSLVAEPRSWSSHIAVVVVMVVVPLVVLVAVLLKLQKKNIAFPASATLSQQAGDAGLMQELAELTQPEDTSGGDRNLEVEISV
ncbi:titin-like [Platysternon megacephalum]|uniref:Titin-like n=1 Tax=Platysternon megacephalum TaxID=55544 RepID=A0A4D9DSA3_9SAUR|nr:titin-like [Platysternon megacephalum]